MLTMKLNGGEINDKMIDWLTDYSCSSRVAEVLTEVKNGRQT